MNGVCVNQMRLRGYVCICSQNLNKTLRGVCGVRVGVFSRCLLIWVGCVSGVGCLAISLRTKNQTFVLNQDEQAPFSDPRVGGILFAGVLTYYQSANEKEGKGSIPVNVCHIRHTA